MSEPTPLDLAVLCFKLIAKNYPARISIELRHDTGSFEGPQRYMVVASVKDHHAAWIFDDRWPADERYAEHAAVEIVEAIRKKVAR